MLQFSHTMTAQADLRVEAAHLQRFLTNFHRLHGSVVIPQPIEGACHTACMDGACLNAWPFHSPSRVIPQPIKGACTAVL